VAKSETEQFVLETHTGSITVLGTQFTVDTRSNRLQIFVSEGTVRYDHGNRHIVLEVGDMLSLNDGDILKVKSDGKEVTSWLPQKLSFRNERLAVVIEKLSEHFGQEIVIDNHNKVKNCRVNTSFQKETIEQILNELTLTLGLKYQRKGEILHIVDASC